MNSLQLCKDIEGVVEDLGLEEPLTESILNKVLKRQPLSDLCVYVKRGSKYYVEYGSPRYREMEEEVTNLFAEMMDEILNDLKFIVKNEYEDYVDQGYDDRVYALKRYSVVEYKGDLYKGVWVDYSTYDYELESLNIVEKREKVIQVYE